ncbi:hypothetical protein D0T85_09110 [Bacteroides sp. 519]|nr:hypothetical protein [Bacteroides sp. 519]
MKPYLLVLLLLATFTLQAQTSGDLQLPPVYSDNMVLQRNQPLTIAGTANAGETIKVSIGNQKKETITSSEGKWLVTLAPLQTGKVYQLEVSSHNRKLVYKNVLAGEVWLCSGQSNMEFEVRQTVKSEQEYLLNRANQQPIRIYDTKARWRTNAVEWSKPALDSINNLHYFHHTTWTVCNTETASRTSAVAFSFANMLADSLNVPVGLIINAVGGSATESWIDRKTLETEFPDILYNWTENDFIQPWVRQRAKQNMAKSNNKYQRHPYEPTYLFESAILPLNQFTVKGVIWYQGESNAHNVEAHEKLFPLLIKSWRTHWQQDIPFYYVQLSSINRPSWPWFRNSQRLFMDKIPNVKMAVSSDRGDSLDVHPKHKKDIGERLARWALHETYQKQLIPSGPLVKKAQCIKDTAVILFNYGDGLSTSDGKEIRTLEIAGKDEQYYPAEYKIISGNKLMIWHQHVTTPQWVRYGWQPYTRANLVNEAGLPASTFKIEIEGLH